MKTERFPELRDINPLCRMMLCLSLASGLCGSAFAMPTVNEIVAAYAEHQDHLLRFTDTYRLEETWDDPSIRHALKGSMFVQGEFAHDGARYMQEYRFWYDPPSPTESSTNPSVNMTLWDGSAVWGFVGHVTQVRKNEPRGRLCVQPNVRSCPKFGPYYFENPRHNITVRNYHGREAMGFLLFVVETDARRVDEVLLAAPSPSLRPNTEREGGAECYVVDASTPKGHLSVWFDPARQYNIAKAVWRYRPTAKERVQRWEETYVVHGYTEAHGLSTPKETTRERHIEWANGEVGRRVARFRRLTFEVNPDFTAHNTFTFLGKIDDGTRVLEIGCAGPEPNTHEHLDRTVRQYILRNGQLVLTNDYGGSKTPSLTGIP